MASRPVSASCGPTGRKATRQVRKSSSDLVLRSLYDLVDGLEDGARLPTVRELMRTFHVSQAAVQRAFGALAAEGLVTSQVGRGTFVTRAGGTAQGAPGRADRALDSLLILSNASMNQRCVLVQNHIVEEMAAGGSKVVQMSYHNTGHLLDILGSLPRFDAAILQSHYENIPVRLLQLLQEKATALTVDGHTLSGVDIDRVGTDWEDALLVAEQPARVTMAAAARAMPARVRLCCTGCAFRVGDPFRTTVRLGRRRGWPGPVSGPDRHGERRSNSCPCARVRSGGPL